ncbi:MAG: hypothetical protein HY658_04610 [Actinobacteria bacterium]|nr:hypothetical protein [Actinomycetota bacterium]
MALEAVYWVTLGVGLGILAISLLLGDIFDFFDVDIGDTGLPIIPVFFAAMSAFGAGGLLGIELFGLGTRGSVVTGLGVGLGAGALTALLFAALRRQETHEGFELSHMIGERGMCTLSLGPGRVGKVSVHHAGMTRSFPATSDETIGAGEEVVVRDVVGETMRVARPETADTPGS